MNIYILYICIICLGTNPILNLSWGIVFAPVRGSIGFLSNMHITYDIICKDMKDILI